MHTKREIRFKTSESKSRLNEGTTCYQGQLIHNRTLDKADGLLKNTKLYETVDPTDGRGEFNRPEIIFAVIGRLFTRLKRRNLLKREVHIRACQRLDGVDCHATINLKGADQHSALSLKVSVLNISSRLI